MSQPIISVENLSKSYLIGHHGTREPYTSLRDTLSTHAKNFTRRTLDTLRGKQMVQGDTTEEFWALKDVSFEVQQGEVLGIIGRNGAGKSTLLKILSRITEPTGGKVTIRGRVASLLEVGTGFHPELSGRENIFLNGAILGMSRKEIKAKFDEIVDFAGVEKFLDTPVKRYSSGMYVRLAFAVAAHLEPEILIVDEVLAVGDAEFQKKCMGKMKDVASMGRTILFVSHNLKAIHDLCTKSCLLNSGKLVQIGEVKETLNKYLDSEEKTKINKIKEIHDRIGNQEVKFVDLSFHCDGESSPGLSATSSQIEIKLTYEAMPHHVGNSSNRFSIAVKNREDTLFVCSTELHSEDSFKIKEKSTITCIIPRLPLANGIYYIEIFCEVNGIIQDWIKEASSFEVTWGKFFNTNLNCPIGYEGSTVLVPHKWEECVHTINQEHIDR